MAINRTSYDFQSRGIGMLLTSGRFETNGTSAPDGLSVDVGTTVARTGVGTFLVTIPANQSVNFRSVYAHAFSPTIAASITDVSDRTIEITTTQGTTAPASFNTSAVWHEADAAPGTTYSDFPLITFPTDGTLLGVTAIVNADVASGGPGNGFSFTCGKSSGGAPTPLTGGSGNIVDTALTAFNPMDFTFSVPAELDVLEGETLTVNLNKIVNGQQLPIHAFTVRWLPSAAFGPTATAVDSNDVTICYEILIKNSSAK